MTPASNARGQLVGIVRRRRGVMRAAGAIGAASTIGAPSRLPTGSHAGAARGASIFKMADQSRHKSMDTLRGYVRDAEIFQRSRWTRLTLKKGSHRLRF
jgi:hypothetical protein